MDVSPAWGWAFSQDLQCWPFWLSLLAVLALVFLASVFPDFGRPTGLSGPTQCRPSPAYTLLSSQPWSTRRKVMEARHRRAQVRKPKPQTASRRRHSLKLSPARSLRQQSHKLCRPSSQPHFARCCRVPWAPCCRIMRLTSALSKKRGTKLMPRISRLSSQSSKLHSS